MLSMIVYEYTGIPGFAHGAGALAVAAILGFSIGLGLRRATFLAVATMLVSFTIATRSDWHIGLLTAAERGAFVVALFAALSAIRSAAATSRTMLECGRFLAGQPPGRRYLALTTGGHLFGLILMYGSISLLGGLAVESTSREPNPTIRQWRLRRMLVAINRGFASTLCWSPIGFSMAITVSLIPGASWSGVALYGLVSTVLRWSWSAGRWTA